MEHGFGLDIPRTKQHPMPALQRRASISLEPCVILALVVDAPAIGDLCHPSLTRIRLRHEALLSRMEVRDRPSPRRRSGGVKLEAA
jgi:hypothetical protein